MTQRSEPGGGPCAGIRVLDFSMVISGPFCTQALGDLGADVIKVEPPAGDSSRLQGAPFREPGFSAFMAQFNRNKRSIMLDLKQQDGRAVARRLAAGCDVVVENFRPGVADRLGVGYEALRAENEKLVYVSISGYGSDGPYRELPTYDHVIQALTGLMPLQGSAEAPELMRGAVVDKCTALTAVSAVLGGLLARERQGVGQHIEVPMLDAYAAYALPESMVPRTFPPLVSQEPGVSDYYRTFATADGFVVGITVRDSEFLSLCKAIGRTDLASDPRFSTPQGRGKHFRELVPILAEEIRKLTTAEFVARARAEGAAFAAANDLDGFLGDPQVAHNVTAPRSLDPRFGEIHYLRHPVRYGATPASLRRHPPRLGEHTREILAAAGYSPGEIEALRESGAAG